MPAAGMLGHHPLTAPFAIPVAPVLAAAGVAVLVVVVTFVAGPRRTSDRPWGSTASWDGRLSRPQVATRAIAVALLLVAIVAARAGADDELENLAPALVVGSAWPLLMLVSAVIGPVWRWLDPWDALARVLGSPRSPHAEREDRSVWPAVVPAAAWMWYLSVYPDPLDPRSLGLVLGLYSVVIVAGALAFGRGAWLSRVEALGILLSWVALVPRRGLSRWVPPRGAEALLGVTIGGSLFAAIRRSELWGGLNTAPRPVLLATLGAAGAATIVTGLLLLVGRAGRTAVVRAAVPAMVGVVVAIAMERNRLTTSVQLLPALVGDPFGRGWDVFGHAGAGLVAEPLGTAGLIAAQLGVVALGHVAGAVTTWVFRRGDRDGAGVGLAVLAYGAVVAIASH